MWVATLKLCKIRFRIVSDFVLPYFLLPPFVNFSVKETHYDVSFVIRSLESVPSGLPPLNARERELLARSLHVSSIDGSFHDNLLLNTKIVRETLYRAWDTNDSIFIHIARDTLAIINLSRLELFLFVTRKGQEHITSCKMGAPLFYPFLPEFSALLLHSAGLIINSKGILFLAPDEGGKTTIIKKAKDKQILSDDQNIVREENGGLVVYSTPWGTMSGGQNSAPLTALFVLKKGNHFSLSPIKPSNMLEFLWNEFSIYSPVFHSHLQKKVLNLISKISFSIPAYEMVFSKNYVDWNSIVDTISGSYP